MFIEGLVSNHYVCNFVHTRVFFNFTVLRCHLHVGYEVLVLQVVVEEENGLGIQEDFLYLSVNIRARGIHRECVMSKCGTVSGAVNNLPLAGNHRGLALQAVPK